MTQLACEMECKFKKAIQSLVLNLATNFANCFLDAPNYGLVYVLREQSIGCYLKKEEVMNANDLRD